MSEISLRDYFAKLEQLLSTNAADEVIHHCRHILQYYPKNVIAYRFLGRALLVNGRWDEATAALRRVLSVIPDDYAAHLGLSEIYDHKQKADDAIWHLERAFEQNPNNNQLLDGIRALYRRYRDVDQAKVQLTAAAVARQALRNQQYEHAIDTLRDGLERQPDRVDLQLLLATALWDSGDHVEAAETALDVLQVLPDCLEANRILTKLWLEEDRPSDAQRYLNRVEAIDPYIAVEVAQGQATSDDAFHLEELDYARSAQSELTVNRPDWLKDITGEVPQVDTSRADWSNFASSMLASSASAQTEEEEEKPTIDLFGDDATMLTEIPAPATPPSPADEDEIPAEFAALPSEFEALDDAPISASAADPNDPMAWLHGSGVELFDEELPPFEAAQQEAAEEASDSLAWLQEDAAMDDDVSSSRPMPDSEAFSWMQNYDVEVSDEIAQSEPENELEPAAEEAVPEWLKDEGFLDEALGIEQLTGSDTSEEPDWLNLSASRKQTAELPEQTPPEMRPTTPIRDSFQKDEGLFPETDWLKDVSEDEPQPVPGPRRGLTAMLSEANLDWLQEKPAEPDLQSDEVMDEWLAQFGGAEPKSEPLPAEQDPSWLTELDTSFTDEVDQPDVTEEVPDWLSEPTDAESEFTASETASNWAQDDVDEPASAEMPDWMADLQPETTTSAESTEDAETETSDEFDWSAAEVAVEEPEPSNMPDWMMELEPTSTYETPSTTTFEHESSGEESEFEWLPEEGVVTEKPTAEEEAEFAWLDQEPAAVEDEDAFGEFAASTESQPSVDPVSSADYLGSPNGQDAEFELDLGGEELPLEMPDWLSDLQPQPQSESDIEAQPVAALDDDDSWLDEQPVEEPEEEAVENEAVEEEVVSVDVPDWLSDLQPQPQSQLDTEAEPVATLEDDDSWLDQEPVGEPVEDPSEEEAVTADVPDWLSDLQPQPQAEPVATLDDDDSWLDEQPMEAGEEEVVEEDVVAEEVPDWLSDLQPQPQAEPVAALDDDDSWLDEQPVEEPEEEVVAEEVPDWLSDLQPQPQTEPVAALDDDDSWLDEQPDEEAEPVAALDDEAVAADVPDWLSDLQPQPQAESDTEAEPVAALDDDDSWLDDATEMDAAVAMASAQNDQGFDDLDADDEPIEQQEAIGESSSEFGWHDEADVDDAAPAIESDDDFTFQPIRKTETDELEAVPSHSLTEEPDDEDDYWINDEQAEIETVNGAQPVEDDINEFEGLTVFPSDEMDTMRDDDFEPVPASNAPDWLNAMVPGLDVDFEASEDEPLETEFEGEATMEHPAHSRDFDWVEEIVEEESRQPETAAAVAEPAQPRYIFSRPPSWLNELSEPVPDDDDLPDWPSDVPDWLR